MYQKISRRWQMYTLGHYQDVAIACLREIVEKEAVYTGKEVN